MALGTALHAAQSSLEAEKIVFEALTKKLSAVLGIDKEDMAPTSSIVAFGLDSLLAIEVRNWTFRELSVSFQVLELMTSNDDARRFGQRNCNSSP